MNHPGARCLFVLWLVVQALPSRAAQAPCPDEQGRVFVIEPGRERDIAALIEPMTLGGQMPPPHSEWTLNNAAVRGDSITFDLSRGDTTRTLVVRPRRCREDAEEVSVSFVTSNPLTEVDRGGPVEALWRVIQRRDQSLFYRSEADTPPPPGAVGDPNGASRQLQPGVENAGEKPGEVAWNQTLLALGVLILMALLAILWDAPGMLAAVGLRGPGAPPAWGALIALMAIGWGLRWMADATFIREAYPLPDVHFLLESIVWSHATSPYPETPNLMIAGLASLSEGENPYRLWMSANMIFGALTIFATYLLGASISRSRPVITGLVVAGLVTFWPQHIRLSASESTHVVMVLWATLSLAWAASASTRLGWAPFVGLVVIATLTATTRPEAALIAPALGILALGHGVEVRRRLRSPLAWCIILGCLILVWPTLMTIAADSSVDRFDPSEDAAEALGLHSVFRLLWTLFIPSVDNAFFDPATAPLWLYPFALWGCVHGWRTGHRAATGACVVMLVTYQMLYTGLPPSVTLWGMSRYHLSAFPAVAVLAGFGVIALVPMIPSVGQSSRRLVITSLLIGVMGCGLYWPAMAATKMDWQQELHWLIALGDDRPLTAKGARLVVPDNRRRFRDLNPRSVIAALSRGEQSYDAAATVEQAIRTLEPTKTTALYYEGLYCYLALGPGETFNPQCEAMHRNFELKPIETLRVDAPCFLTVYEALRAPGELTLTLFEITARRGVANGDLSGLPSPWDAGQQPPDGWETMGSQTETFIEPPAPPF